MAWPWIFAILLGASSALGAEPNSELNFDQIDRDCHFLDDATKLPESRQMMDQCTSLMAKNKQSRAYWKWSLVWLHRNLGRIEDGKCFRQGKAIENKELKLLNPSKADIINRGIENRCFFIVADARKLCMKKESLKNHRWIRAYWINLCNPKEKLVRPLKIPTQGLSCSATGAFAAIGKLNKGHGQNLMAIGMNEPNSEFLWKIPLDGKSKKFLNELGNLRTAMFFWGNSPLLEDPSLCSRPKSPDKSQ